MEEGKSKVEGGKEKSEIKRRKVRWKRESKMEEGK